MSTPPALPYDRDLVTQVDRIASALEQALGMPLPRRLHGKIMLLRASDDLRAWLDEVAEVVTKGQTDGTVS